MSEKQIEKSTEVMTERYEFSANGYSFTVKPVFLGEEDAYFADVSYALYPVKKDGKEVTEKDLSHFAMALWRKHDANPKKDDSEPEKVGFLERVKIFIAKKFTHTYEYYSDVPSAAKIAKWVEKKVSYKGKPVKFYDLERKFQLSKSEIVNLLKTLQDASGF